MNILYGIHSNENGHLNRSSLMVDALRKKGINVTTIFSGRILPNSNQFVQTLKPIAQYKGLTTVVENGQNKFLKSFKRLSLKEFFKDVRNLDLSPYDLVLNDFEHVSAWAARKQKKRCIGITRACTFRYKIPWPKTHIISKLVYSHDAPCDVKIGLHWHHFNQPILPPISAMTAHTVATEEKDFILVYLAGESLETLDQVLTHCHGNFRIYHPEIKDYSEQGNLQFNSINTEKFKKELCACKGIITHGGFNTLTEGLLLGKPLLVKPKKNLMEQVANAMALEHLGFGQNIKKLTVKNINAWIEGLKPMRRLDFPNYVEELIDWILQHNAEDLPGFSKRIWSKINNGFD